MDRRNGIWNIGLISDPSFYSKNFKRVSKPAGVYYVLTIHPYTCR